MVSAKRHLIENSKLHGVNLLALAPFKFWPQVFNCESSAKARTWCLLGSMCRLDLKITFLCLRPGLRFNLQTLVCICDGLGLFPRGQQDPITKAQTHTAA